VNPKFLNPEPYRAEFLTPESVREFAKDPGLDMTPEFVEDASSKGDRCFGILDGGTLVAYTWYSHLPTRIFPPDLLLHFDHSYVYMYKAFTRVPYRGRRLHAIGKTLVLREYLSLGFRGLLSAVEYLNFPSLKSVKRIGGRLFGSLYVVGAVGRYLVYGSRGCRRFGFRLERLPAVLEVSEARLSSPTAQIPIRR
jgi:hypothetical protein